MLINVVALEMLKAKMPQFASRSLRSSHLEMINLIPLTSVHTLLRPVWRKVAKSSADIVASQALSRLVYTAEMTPPIASAQLTHPPPPYKPHHLMTPLCNFSHPANLSAESKGVPGVQQTKVHSASSDEVFNQLSTHVTSWTTTVVV